MNKKIYRILNYIFLGLVGVLICGMYLRFKSNPFWLLADTMDMLYDPLLHFLLPFSAALLVGRGMLGIFSVLYRKSVPLTPKWVNTVVVGGIAICCLLAMVAIGSLFHYLLDYVLYLWDMPLGEPLELELPDEALSLIINNISSRLYNS